MPYFGGSLYRRRKPIAVGGAILLHVLVIWCLIRPSSGQLGVDADLGSSQTGAEVAFYTPGPTGDTAMHPAPSPPPLTQALDRFADMSDTQAEAQPLKAPQPTQSLDQVFGKDLFAQNPKAAQTPQPSDSHVAIDGRNSHTVNDLWKAIAPCWYRLAGKQAMGVRLSVSFSALGNLSKPPVIVREAGSALTDQRLKSESLAISALTQCGPYPMAFGQSDVTVDFPAGG